jgi:hypothetical protein
VDVPRFITFSPRAAASIAADSIDGTREGMVMAKRWALTAAVVAAGLAAGCGKDGGGAERSAEKSSSDAAAATDTDASPPTEKEMADQAEQTRKALAQMNGGKEVKAVDAKDLKALLPDAIAGAKRRNAESQKISQMGMDISTTRASYDPEQAAEGEAAPQPSFNVEIMDLGNLGGSMAMSYAAWSLTQYEKETDAGYEKTTKYKGFPGMEKYDRESKYGELHVYVAKRFILQVSGNDATIEQIRAAVDAIDVGKLESLAK